MTTPDGKVRTFKTKEQAKGPTEWRTMDCVDCHNRPSHTFKPPALEVDSALEDGRIDKTLPFIKREALRVLDGIYASHEEARAACSRGGDLLRQLPGRGNHEGSQRRRSRQGARRHLRLERVPEDEGHLGHVQEQPRSRGRPGLRALPRQEARGRSGTKIGGGCKTCHTILAEDEADPEILSTLKP